MGRNKIDFHGGKNSHPVALSAKNILSTYHIAEVGGTKEWQKKNPDSVKSYLDKKYENAGYARNGEKSLVQSISEKGYDKESPLHIRHFKNGVSSLINGHHRLAVMLKHNPDAPIPLKHFVDEH
jgi:hypothetical protein